MKTLSLWQPFATGMAAGYKRIETRSWRPRDLQPGQLVAIHAAKHWTGAERELVWRDGQLRQALAQAEQRGLWDFDQPTLGCVVAIARYAGAVRTEELRERISAVERAFGNYQPGRWGWMFSAVRPLAPIPAQGQQYLFDWTPPADILYLEPRNEVEASDLARILGQTPEKSGKQEGGR